MTGSDGTGVPDPDVVATVGFHSRANIPTIEGPRREGATIVRGYMGKDTDARGSQRRTIGIKDAMNMCVGRQFWVDAGATAHVECHFSLRQ